MKPVRSVRSVLAAALVSLATIAPASAVSVSGELTATDPTYNRVFWGDCSQLDGQQTNVFYDVYALSVSVSGSFDLETTVGGDTFLTLYSPSFNPASPTTNCIAKNDDDGAGNLSLIDNFSLTAGTPYFVVVTSFFDGSTFDYTLQAVPDASNTTGGVATLTAVNGSVPEPGTLALLGLGLAGLAASRRRRQ